MKLIFAIVSHDDSQRVIRELTHGGFQVTKLATTGGFLMAGNATLIAGVQDNKVDAALELIRKSSRSRRQTIPAMNDPATTGAFASAPIEVTVGGATVFVLDVDRFEKI